MTERCQEALREADDLLRRLAAWDMLSTDLSGRPVTADGPYWQREIWRVRQKLAEGMGCKHEAVKLVSTDDERSYVCVHCGRVMRREPIDHRRTA